MSGTLWAQPASDLLARTASADPTPGGGSVAAVCGALGVGLLQMAVAVTADASLDDLHGQLARLRERVAAAADADVEVFGALIAAYRLPRADEAATQRRREAIEAQSTGATEGPLALVAALVEAVELSHHLEPAVKPDVVSDVLAGRDIVLGSARAAIRTADVNLAQLDRLSSPRAPGLRQQRDELARRLEGA